MSNRRRPHRRHASWRLNTVPVTIRVFNRHGGNHFREIRVVGPEDEHRFAGVVDEQTSDFPQDPLIIAINGYQPWLDHVLRPCVDGNWNEISDVGREVQFANTMQFPERGSKQGSAVPWTFILDHINVPQVYYWSVDMEPPEWDEIAAANLDRFRFRTGVWMCGRGACRYDTRIPVVIIFTRPTQVSEHIVTELLFDYLRKDTDFTQPREDEEGVCWIFSRLYYLLTDWQNIISELDARLDEAEENSHGRHLPLKMRTRRMHHEVGRLYELKEYLYFHMRAFKKLQKLKDSVPKDEQRDFIWNDMDDAIDDLTQYDSMLDGLKDRFNNLIELEFNITNATQSENSQFLSSIATLFLPISFLASLFGMTTVTWPIIWYLWIAIPVFIISAAFTAVYPWSKRRVQEVLYPIREHRLYLQPNQFTMLGQELPANVDVPQSRRPSTAKRKGQRPGSRSRLNMRSEKISH